MLPYQQSQQGLVRNSSLWGGKIGGQKPVWTSLHPPILTPPPILENKLSRYSHLSDSIHWGSLDIIKRVRPETQAHDLRDMLLLKSMYFRLYSVYSIGIPLFLENKSYPGIPTPRSWKSVTIPTIPTGSGQKLKPLGWSGVKNRFGPHCTPPPKFCPPPNSREQELSRYSHLSDSIHWGSLKTIKRVRPETQAHDLRNMLLLKCMYFRFFSVYNIGIPLFLENKSYPGIPTPRSWKSVTIPTIPTGSGKKLKPLGW